MIRAVVVGLGRIGFSLSHDPYREKPCTHVGAIKKNQTTRLIGGIDLDEEKRSAFKKATGIPAFLSWQELISTVGKPDLLSIATPASTHGLYLREALTAQVPVVVLEKPIAPTYAEALALKSFYDRRKNSPTRVVINHERRFADDYLYVKKLIENRTLGKLCSITGSLYTNVPTNINTLLHDATHLIDIVNFLSTKSPKGEKNVISKFNLLTNNRKQGIKFYAHFNEVPTYLEIGGEKDYFHFELSLSFSKGKIEIGNNIFAEYRAKPSKLYRGFTSLAKTNRTFSKTKYFANMLKHAVWLYQNPQALSGSSLNDAFLIYEVMKKITAK